MLYMLYIHTCIFIYIWVYIDTVSQKQTEGSAVLISTSEYMRRRSCITQSRYSSPVPKTRCSPLSSTLVERRG